VVTDAHLVQPRGLRRGGGKQRHLVHRLEVGEYLAGVPGRWAPLVIGGALGLMTALVAGAPRREEGEG
jgi:hypothetical protein